MLVSLRLFYFLFSFSQSVISFDYLLNMSYSMSVWWIMYLTCCCYTLFFRCQSVVLSVFLWLLFRAYLKFIHKQNNKCMHITVSDNAWVFQCSMHVLDIFLTFSIHSLSSPLSLERCCRCAFQFLISFLFAVSLAHFYDKFL